MQIHSVKLINYKSIGNYPESEIIIEPNVTAIIGKNESGKTNVLQGLSEVSFTTPDVKAFSVDKANRTSSSEASIEYEITLKPSPLEQEMGIHGETHVRISGPNSCTLTGGIVDYYKRECYEEFSSLGKSLDAIGANQLQIKQTDERQRYRDYLEELAKEDCLNVYLRKTALVFLGKKISSSHIEQKDELEAAFQAAKEKWIQLLNLFPVFYYRKPSACLNARYRFEEVRKELDHPDSPSNTLLCDLVKLIRIPPNDFITAAQSGSSSRQFSIRERIRKNVDSELNKLFQEFYTTERVNLRIEFNAGVVSFTVVSSEGELLSLSERSNGLRWYLELFIDLKSNDIPDRNVVYLLDEPGTSLHVNAQRELLRLFRNLADKGNQVVFSTHSPYMLDVEEGIHRIRAVVKDSAGYTRIYKTAYDAKIAPDSQEDTLAPIIEALGMGLDSTFGPALNKTNVILEGMSDYIYLKTMSKLLSINLENCELIPSVGASNCINIACILHGWGCRYFAVFDYDKGGAGSGGEQMKNKLGLEYRKQYCYLADVSQDQIDAKTYLEPAKQCEIEDMFSRNELARFREENSVQEGTGKPLLAKLVCNAIESHQFEPSEETKENFRRLIERILSYVQ